MDYKIEFIEDNMIKGQWHWFIMKYTGNGWCNAGCGLEESFEKAVSESKKYYDEKKAGDMQ